MEYCPARNKSTLELAVHTKGFVSISRCSYLKDILKLSYDEIKDLDLFSLNYDDFFRKKSSPLCTVNCTPLNSEIRNLVIGISKACNLNCYNCFNSYHEDSEEDKELYFYLLERAKGHNLNSLLLGSQGEVFTYYNEITTYLRSLTTKDFKIIILQTNATLLDESRLEELKEISKSTGIKYQFFISMNGITKETYENTHIGANFDRTLLNVISILEKFDSNDTRITFVLKKTNISDAPNIRKFFKDLGFKHIDISYDFYDFGCKEVYNKLMQSEVGQCIYETFKNEKCAGSNKLKKYKYFTNKLLVSDINAIYSRSIEPLKDLMQFEEELVDEEKPVGAVPEVIKDILEEDIICKDTFKEPLLTIGITMHGNQELSESIEREIRLRDKISWIISNDLSQTSLDSLKVKFSDLSNISYYLSKPGIENNRQNILNHTETKYLYVIDYDDDLYIDQDKVLSILEKTDADILPVNPLENGLDTSDYIYYDEATIFVTTWAQVFKTNFLRRVGGYIQTWNFYHEEFGTNANILANIYKEHIKYVISEVLEGSIEYNHLLGDVVDHNSQLKIKISDYIKFILGIPKNDSITYKKEFLELFKLRLNLMNLTEKDYDLLSRAINKVGNKV